MRKERAYQFLAVQQHLLNILVRTTVVRGHHREFLSILKVHCRLVEQRATDGIERTAWANLVEAHGIQYIPCRHLPTVFITRKPVRIVEIKRLQYLVHQLLRAPGLAHLVVEVNDMVTRLITMGILPYQAGNVGRH